MQNASSSGSKAGSDSGRQIIPMKHTGNYASILLVAALSLFVFLFVLFVYAFLHEAGHAVVGLFFGQSVTEFSINIWALNAHVGMSGGELSQTQLAIRSVAGAALPFLIWLVFIGIVPRKASFTLEVLKLVSSITVVNTLLVWIILPVLFLFGTAPPDDVTNLLRYSQIPPLLLSGTALSLYAGGWILFFSKINGLQNQFLLFRTIDCKYLLRGARTTIPVMAGLLTICISLSFALNRNAGTSPNRLSPPPDFYPVAQVDLSAQPYSGETIVEFTLDAPTMVGIFLVVDDIDTAYFDLKVSGPDGYSSGILHGEGYRIEQDGGLWGKNLQSGTYQIVLTAHQSPGTAGIYLNIPE